MRFAATRETPQWAIPGSLLETGGDFGFGWGTGGGLLSGLPSGAREIVGSIYGAIRTGTGRVVIAPQPTTQPSPPPRTPEEGEVVAHDWGHLGRELLGGVIGQAIGQPVAYAPPAFQSFAPPYSDINQLGGTVNVPTAAAPAALVNECGLDGQAWGGQAPPKGYKVVNYCNVATLRKIRRRRRRRMLSVSDKNDIASIVSMVGKGQMASALINRTSP